VLEEIVGLDATVVVCGDVATGVGGVWIGFLAT